MISVVSLRIVPCHVTSQRERKSSSRLAWYTSNALRPSSVRVLKVGLRMLHLLRSDPLLTEFPPFMLDVLKVVDSPAELPKCVHTWNEQRLKPVLKTAEIEYSGLANRRVQFYRDRQQSWAPRGFDEVLLLRPSGIWMVERHGARQFWRLKGWVRDLIDKKKRKLEN
jgi:hypothetical protein